MADSPIRNALEIPPHGQTIRPKGCVQRAIWMDVKTAKDMSSSLARELLTVDSNHQPLDLP
jgi:hypothetical protein